MVLKVKSSEFETHDVVEGFELYKASIRILENSIDCERQSGIEDEQWRYLISSSDLLVFILLLLLSKYFRKLGSPIMFDNV